MLARVNQWRKGLFHGWWMVLIGGLLNCISSGFYGTGFTVYFLPLSRDLGLSRAATSTVFGVERIEGGFWSLISGFLIDRWGARVMMVVGAVVAGAGFLLLSRTHNYTTFLLVYLGILSLGIHIGFNMGVMASLNNWFVRRRGLAFSLMAVGISLGGVVITPVIGLVVLAHGWRTAAAISGVAVLALSVPLALLMRNTPEEMGLRPDGAKPEGAPPRGAPSSYVPTSGVDFTARQAFKTWSFWLLALALSLRIGVRQAVFVHIIPLLVWKGSPEKNAVLMVGIFSISSAASRAIAGWVGDRWSRQRTIAAGMLIGTASMAMVMVSGSALWQLALFLALFGAVDSVASLSWAMVGDFFGRRAFATLRGVSGFLVSVASMVFPIVTGLVYDMTKSYYPMLIPLAAMYLGIAVLFLVIRGPKGAPAPGSDRGPAPASPVQDSKAP